ncbi:MAG: 1-deoxy-D-xylulose-5-phosphate reductoisomerase [Planctomycetaceae bacterium]
MNRIAILGSTGSIGRSCLDVIRSQPHKMTVAGLTAHGRWQSLAEQSRRFHPRRVVLTDASLADSVDPSAFNEDVSLEFGEDAIQRLASDPETDVVVSAIVGAAGLRGTWAAVEAGKRVALANKETLVVAGPLVRQLASRTGSVLIPVDSEHSAIFQALRCGRASEVRRIVLTASGGPFRGWSQRQLDSVTPDAALAHPTWQMGRKITIDSATMMNKALEIIEAKWLFDLDVDQIEIVLHPQSIIHSFVEFIDGSVIAQMSPPDMKLPIQYALTYPDRTEGISAKMDWNQSLNLEIMPPDTDAFPAIQLGFDVARQGGSSGAVLNAANEVAVERFLSQDLSFRDIPRACRAVLEAHQFDPNPTLERLLTFDAWARKETRRWRS